MIKNYYLRYCKKNVFTKNLENYLDKFKLYMKNDFKNDQLLLNSFPEILSSVKNVNFDNQNLFLILKFKLMYDQTLEFLQFINKE